MNPVRTFQLNRKTDLSGVSGTGLVAYGALFPNGKVALTWISPHTSVGIYDSIEAVEAIHGHGGATVIEWHG
jgi:hypothetical protein